MTCDLTPFHLTINPVVLVALINLAGILARLIWTERPQLRRSGRVV